jgi:hypothetical protein
MRNSQCGNSSFFRNCVSAKTRNRPYFLINIKIGKTKKRPEPRLIPSPNNQYYNLLEINAK